MARTLRGVGLQPFPALSFTCIELRCGPSVRLVAGFECACEDDPALVYEVDFDAVHDQTHLARSRFAVATKLPECCRGIVHRLRL